MAEVKLVNVKKIYPFVSGEEKKSKKKKKGEEPAEEKKVNLQISEATVEKQEEALRKKRSLSSRCPSYKNSAPAGRQIKQTEDTGFETQTKPHGILGRIKGLFDKFRK